jgi:hypothetical protein
MEEDDNEEIHISGPSATVPKPTTPTFQSSALDRFQKRGSNNHHHHQYDDDEDHHQQQKMRTLFDVETNLDRLASIATTHCEMVNNKASCSTTDDDDDEGAEGGSLSDTCNLAAMMRARVISEESQQGESVSGVNKRKLFMMNRSIGASSSSGGASSSGGEWDFPRPATRRDRRNEHEIRGELLSNNSAQQRMCYNKQLYACEEGECQQIQPPQSRYTTATFVPPPPPTSSFNASSSSSSLIRSLYDHVQPPRRAFISESPLPPFHAGLGFGLGSSSPFFPAQQQPAGPTSDTSTCSFFAKYNTYMDYKDLLEQDLIISWRLRQCMMMTKGLIQDMDLALSLMQHEGYA